MNGLFAIAIVTLVYLLMELIQRIYDRVTYNIIINSVNEEFRRLLEENDHKLDYHHIEDFMSKHYDIVEDINFDLDENNNITYVLKFRD